LAAFLITFLSPLIATSINIHVLFSLSRIIMSGLLLGMVLSVWTCWFHSMVTLPPWPVSTDFGACSYQCFCPIVPPFPYICWSVVVHTLYRVFLCTVLLTVRGMPILYGLLSHQTVSYYLLLLLLLFLEVTTPAILLLTVTCLSASTVSDHDVPWPYRAPLCSLRWTVARLKRTGHYMYHVL
jgi:hypothetical protein